MRKEFNILYWNIHFTAYNQDDIKLHRKNIEKNKYLDLSSEKIIIPELERYIAEKDIKVIVLTEGWPQNEKFSCKIKDFLEDKKYTLYPYCDEWKKESLPYKCNGRSVSNGILIGVKNEYKNENQIEIFDYNIEYPNLLVLKDKVNNLFIAGVRIIPSGKDYNLYHHQIEELRYYLEKEYKERPKTKVICIGDFNPGEFENKEKQGEYYIDIEKILNSCRMHNGKLCNVDEGTLVNGKKEVLFTDKLYYVNCSGLEKFEVIKTPERIYCKNPNKFLDGCGRIKFEYLSKDMMLKEEFKDSFYTETAIKCGVQIKYDNCSICNAPFPDHNLLFASIEI